MQLRRESGPLVEVFAHLRRVNGYLGEFAPREWNNIPIPLQELSLQLINFTSNKLKAATYMA